MRVFFLFLVGLIFSLGTFAQDNGEAEKKPHADLKVNNKMEAKVKAPEPAKESGRWRFALGAGYMLSSLDTKFDNLVVSDSSTALAGNSEVKYDPCFTISLEGRKMKEQGWGVIAGLNYEGEREFNSGTVTLSGTTINLTGGSGTSKVQFTTLYGSAAYRWKKLYLPFGLNYSLVDFTPAAGSTGTVDAGGGIGAQLGLGYYVLENFTVEIYSWVTSMTLKGTSGSVNTDFGSGTFPSIVSSAKYVF